MIARFMCVDGGRECTWIFGGKTLFTVLWCDTANNLPILLVSSQGTLTLGTNPQAGQISEIRR